MDVVGWVVDSQSIKKKEDGEVDSRYIKVSPLPLHLPKSFPCALTQSQRIKAIYNNPCEILLVVVLGREEGMKAI